MADQRDNLPVWRWIKALESNDPARTNVTLRVCRANESMSKQEIIDKFMAALNKNTVLTKFSFGTRQMDDAHHQALAVGINANPKIKHVSAKIYAKSTSPSAFSNFFATLRPSQLTWLDIIMNGSYHDIPATLFPGVKSFFQNTRTLKCFEYHVMNTSYLCCGFLCMAMEGLHLNASLEKIIFVGFYSEACAEVCMRDHKGPPLRLIFLSGSNSPYGSHGRIGNLVRLVENPKFVHIGQGRCPSGVDWVAPIRRRDDQQASDAGSSFTDEKRLVYQVFNLFMKQVMKEKQLTSIDLDPECNDPVIGAIFCLYALHLPNLKRVGAIRSAQRFDCSNWQKSEQRLLTQHLLRNKFGCDKLLRSAPLGLWPHLLASLDGKGRDGAAIKHYLIHKGLSPLLLCTRGKQGQVRKG